MKAKAKGLGFLPLGTSSLPIQISWSKQGHATVRPPVCPKHPRGGRDADVTTKRILITCFQCERPLMRVDGPFRTVGLMR